MSKADPTADLAARITALVTREEISLPAEDRDEIIALATALDMERRMRIPSPWWLGLVALLLVAGLGVTLLAGGTGQSKPPLARVASPSPAVSLAGVDLSRVDLRGASLVRADLHNVCLAGARLDGANLTGADLDGADLQGASLEGARLDDVVGRFWYDATTVFPQHASPPSNAVEYSPGQHTPCVSST